MLLLTDWWKVHGLWEACEKQFEQLCPVLVKLGIVRGRYCKSNTCFPNILAAVNTLGVVRLLLKFKWKQIFCYIYIETVKQILSHEASIKTKKLWEQMEACSINFFNFNSVQIKDHQQLFLIYHKNMFVITNNISWNLYWLLLLYHMVYTVGLKRSVISNMTYCW